MIRREGTSTRSEQAVLQLEHDILEQMEDGEMSEFDREGNGRTCFHLRRFGFHRELTRGLLRAMKDKGLVFHAKGLWDDDGMPAGSGYGITAKGREHLRNTDPRNSFDPAKPFGGDGSVPF